MAKQHPEVTLRTHGIYSQWDSASKDLPRFIESTTQIPARVDIEFGMVINVKGGKNLPLSFCIDHPGIRDDRGRRRKPFEDTVYVKTNDWDFYLGDTIWEPIEDKIGTWRMTIELQGHVVAEQSFQVIRNDRRPREARPFRHQYHLVWIRGL